MVNLQEMSSLIRMFSKLLRFSILLLVLIQQLTVNSVNSKEVQINGNIIDATVEIVNSTQIANLLQKHTNIKQLQPRILKAQTKGRGSSSVTLNYRLGDHVLGETSVVHKTHSYQFTTYQSVSIQAHYPAAGSNSLPAIVTFVDITVQQSNYDGRAYVIEGGVGQREILFVIEANNTNFLIYDINIYGVY